MKKTFSFFLLLLLSLTLPAVTFAQATPSGNDPNAPALPAFITPTAPTAQAPTITQNANGTYNVTTPAAAGGTTPAPATPAPNANTTSSGASCGITNIFSFTCVSYVVGLIVYIFLELASSLMWLSGVLLNIALYYGVVNFGQSIGGTAGLGAGWGVLRDLGNIVLIFGFIFIGLQTILGLDNFGVKKTLPLLLLFAILLNFSLFISQAVIDTSNLFSTAIYSSMTSKSTSSCASGSTTASCFTDSGLAGAVSNELGIGTTFNSSALAALGTNANAGVITMIMSTLFVLIAAVVFFAAAIMLIIRIIVLVFLMVLSPIGFAGMALPPLHKYAKQWWDALLSQSFFVPVYLLFTLVGLKVGQGVIAATPGGTGGLAGALASGTSSSVGIFITFSIIIGFMLGALLSAKKLGGVGAEFAVKTAGGAVFGTSAFVTRRTVGRGFNAAATRLEKSEFARKHPFMGNLAFSALDKGAKGSFDFRAAAAGGLKSAKLDLGTAAKGGYAKDLKDATEERVKSGERLKNTAGEEAVIKETNETKAKHTLDHEEKMDGLEKREQELRAAGYKDAADTKRAEIELEKNSYKTQQKAFDRKVDNYSKAPILGLKDEEGKQIEGKEGYAASLKAPVPLIEPLYRAAGPYRQANNAASKDLEKKAKKKKTEKEVDDLIKSLKGGAGGDKPKEGSGDAH